MGDFPANFSAKETVQSRASECLRWQGKTMALPCEITMAMVGIGWNCWESPRKIRVAGNNIL